MANSVIQKQTHIKRVTVSLTSDSGGQVTIPNEYISRFITGTPSNYQYGILWYGVGYGRLYKTQSGNSPVLAKGETVDVIIWYTN